MDMNINLAYKVPFVSCCGIIVLSQYLHYDTRSLVQWVFSVGGREQ